MQGISVILWPSFLVGGAAVGVFFTMVDPQELYLFGEPVHFSKMATYSIGFLAFWALGAASSFLTYMLHRSADEINKPSSRNDPSPNA
jgi:hypothetical protein